MHGDTGVSRGEHSPGRDGGDTLPTDELEELVAACVEAEVRGDQAAVEALLSARPSLAPAARAQIDDLRRSGLLEEQPEQIGPYRIRSLLGRGGMGAVYLAEQEQPVRRLVAVKLIKRGMDTGEVAVRFAAERQALALMSHEHIAKMFDAGATPDGRPYFVMEYVPGVPITEYSDAHRLDLDQRLAMFLQVCAGVRHAHLKGIVHRDLKPSNVLVTEQDGRPVPKIIDFGIAKAVDQRLTADSLRTTAGMLLGTPEYMSPEQAGGDPFDVDLRTDVYSLGVILYELLTGTLPFAPQRLRRDYGQLIDILRSEDPPPPSRQLTRHADTVEMARRRSTTPTLLRRRVRRELDWICCRAMEKERNRRYASVDELAADIRRYLAHEPVLAGPPSDLYRIRKFVRRYRVQVGAAVLVLAAIVAALGISLNALAKEARANALAAQALAGETKARAAAEHDFQRALDAVEQLMHRVAEETLDNLPHMTQVRRQLAADAAAFCRQLLAERADEPRARLQSAATGILLGTLSLTLDDLAGVRAAVQPALDQLEQLRAEQPDNDDLLLRLIQGYEILVTAESRGGATSAAEEAHARALAILRTLTSRQADSPAVRERTGFVLSHLGRSLEKVDLRGALDLYREALRQHEALAGLPGRAETVRRWLAGHHVKIAGALINLGKLAEAEQELERARARLPHASDDESEFEVLQVRADMLLKWSGIYHLTGRKAEALAAGEKEVAIRERILQHDPFVPAHRAALAQAWSHLALFRSAVASDSVETTQISFTDEGLAALQNAVKMFEQLVATCPQTYVYRRSLARSLSNVAYALVRQQRRSSLLAAEQAARRAVEVLAEARGAVGDKGDEDDPDRELNLMNIQATLSDVLFKDGRVREGYEAASRVAEGLAKLTARHPELQEVAIMYARILTGLAQLALEVENLDEARRHAAAARSVVEARFAAELQDPEVREMRIVLARFELEFRAREGDLSVASEAEALIASYGPHEAMGTMAAAGLVHELCWRPALTRDQRAAAALARQSAALHQRLIELLEGGASGDEDLEAVSWKAEAQIALAELAHADGDHARAAALLDAAIPELRRAREELHFSSEREARWLTAHRLRVEGALARGDATAARTVLEHLSAEVDTADGAFEGARLWLAWAAAGAAEDEQAHARREALAALTRSIERGLHRAAEKLADPAFDAVRANPAFETILLRVR